jgi:hypothetical protein
MAYVRRNLNEVVAELPKVQETVKGQAVALEGRMKALIAPHSKTGRLFHSVNVERAFKHKDWWVNVEAKYVVPVNYGFIHHWSHKRVEGLNFIKGALYGA